MMKETLVNGIWKRWPSDYFSNGKPILVVDVYTSVRIIQGGMKSVLQYLDTYANKPFSVLLKDICEGWIENGGEEHRGKDI